MSSKLRRWFVVELTRPLVLVGRLVSKTYSFFFGRFEVRSSQKAEDQFRVDIRENLPFLFHDYGGTILPDKTIKHPRPFDYAVVIVALDDLCLRFIRGRGEFRVQVTSKDIPDTWEDIPLVLNMIDSEFDQRELSSFSDVVAALKPRMKILKEAFAADRFSDLHRRLSDVHDHEHAVIRQWETEINRRLHPDK